MIDTLRLSLTDYTITRGTPLQVQPALVMPGTGEVIEGHVLFSFPDGELIEGAKAFLNTTDFNLTIQSGNDFVPRTFLQCSIPKVGSGSNYLPLSKQGTVEALRRLEGLLKDNGIHTDLAQANVSRLDLFRTAEADNSFSSYSRLFSVLQGKRMKSRDYGTTYLWHNSQQQLCIYDKREEMKVRGYDTAGLPPNPIRFEHRLLNGRKVKAALDLKTCGELVTRYDNLAGYYREKMKSTVFSYQPSDVGLLASKVIEMEMRMFKEVKGSHWLSHYLRSVGYRSLIELSDKKIINDAMESMITDENPESWRKKVYRLTRELARAEADLAMLSSDSAGKLHVLYEELRAKVLQ